MEAETVGHKCETSSCKALPKVRYSIEDGHALSLGRFTVKIRLDGLMTRQSDNDLFRLNQASPMSSGSYLASLAFLCSVKGPFGKGDASTIGFDRAFFKCTLPVEGMSAC